MALNPAHVSNFDTMRLASKNGDLALMECTRKFDGETVAAIAICNRNGDGTVDFVPIAAMLEDPFNELDPPDGAELKDKADAPA